MTGGSSNSSTGLKAKLTSTARHLAQRRLHGRTHTTGSSEIAEQGGSVTAKAQACPPQTSARGIRDTQPDSGLGAFARLPPELRDIVWQWTLGTPTTPAHFHVYPEAVYDACTYHTPRDRDRVQHKRDHLLPKRGRMHVSPQTSLLAVSRTINREVSHHVWAKQKFTVVLCAGLPRPVHNLHGRKSLGKPEDCKSLFAKMRHVELLIQPGCRPQLEAYSAHITNTLQAFRYGQDSASFSLHFNFHGRMDNELRCAIVRCFDQFRHCFGPVGCSDGQPCFKITTETECDSNPSAEEMSYRDALVHLSEVVTCHQYWRGRCACSIQFYDLGMPSGTAAVDMAPARAEEVGDAVGIRCVRRGAWGDYDDVLFRASYNALPPPTRRQVRAWQATVLITSPLIIGCALVLGPAYLAYSEARYAYRRRIKGQL